MGGQMKKFNTIRESAGRKSSNDMVFNKKISGYKVMIHKEVSGFVVYIDGDRLDKYKSQKEAEKMATEFAKELSR